ncbi:hypothetical protein NQ314_014456 [Rhamnusium bicolor]|uniref:Uncharacterized protein n=1 Tax=Rhamnusium bicolor TaxID=1586634 RepID=A0AAV8X467_9CUCU|nr:hypothetical protein NQ314_014456 [Rhamnusium bicolor]
MFWGLTPALDLLKEYELVKQELPEELNILIVDACVENIARQLLLLNIALQPQHVLGLEQKTKIFMELYGNTLVRPTVAKYLTSVATNLVKMVTNYDYLNKIMGFINLEIKYKERDYLENLIKFWCGQEDFNICDSWDRRLRTSLGVRYDAKIGAFDWDLHMRYRNIGGKQVCNQEYKNFRLNGVAFSWLESEVSKPNRSLVCAVFPNGERYAHYGYLGDMQTGPYVAFGLDCEDKSFLQTSNGQNTYRATDVTERNLKQIFYEIANKEEYEHKTTTDVKLGPVVVKEEKLIVDIRAADVVPRTANRCMDMEDSINFLSISTLDIMRYKDKYQNLFDLVYFGNVYLKYFDKDAIGNISKDNSLLFIENQLFVLSNRKKELEEFRKKY